MHDSQKRGGVGSSTTLKKSPPPRPFWGLLPSLLQVVKYYLVPLLGGDLTSLHRVVMLCLSFLLGGGFPQNITYMKFNLLHLTSC